MERDVDYIHWSDEMIYRCDFHNAMFESLSPSSEDIFIRRMENAFPGFSKCVMPGLYTNINSISNIIVSSHLLNTYKLDNIVERAKAFSYTCTLNDSVLYLTFKPDHSPSDLPIENKYIHISPVDTLFIDGIRCKSSGRLEAYEPRIYLRPISSMVDLNLPPDDMYASLINSCKIMAGMFNYKYISRHIIDTPEDYYVYMVELPENFPVYRDVSYDKPSVYVENNIMPDHVTRIGFIEFNKLDMSKPGIWNGMIPKSEIVKMCEGAPKAFTESVLSAYRTLFESEEQQQQQQPVPVNMQNVVNSEEANAIPAMLKDAQTAQKAAETEADKAKQMQDAADGKIQNLRDTLAVASQDTSGVTNA